MERLSERELELFRKMGEGYSTADLASHFDISPSTVETYETNIRKHIVPTLGHILLQEIRATDLSRYYAIKKAEGLSGATLALHHALMRAALKSALRHKSSWTRGEEVGAVGPA